jgi:glycosyltransferase involved in cell wall biosynthesis
MVELGHDVSLITLYGESVVVPKSTEIKIFELGMIKTPFSVIKSYFEAVKIIKSLNVDVVHSHMVHANLFSRILRINTKMNKLICTAHSSNEGGLCRQVFYRLTNRLCDVFTNVSESAVQTFEDKGVVKKKSMICVYNGIDINRFQYVPSLRNKIRSELKIEDDVKVFIAVGSFNEAKDYPNLLCAFQKIASQGGSKHLIIIGDGALRKDLENLISTYAISQYVTMLGIRKDVSELMSAADYFVLSSAWEGFGLVVAEAMACQLPVVATDCGGVREVVGDYGLLCPPKNSNALAENMMQLIRMPSELRRELSINGREYIIRNFSLEEAANKWIEIYLQ